MKLKGSKFRGLAWKVFLGALGPHKENWIAETKRNREEYQQLLKIYELPKDDDELSGDPLSAEQDDQGDYQVDGWGQKFRDQDLKTLIKQDVDRTIPEVAFFQSNKIRNMMCNVLFIHAKGNLQINYIYNRHNIHSLIQNFKWTQNCVINRVCMKY